MGKFSWDTSYIIVKNIIYGYLKFLEYYLSNSNPIILIATLGQLVRLANKKSKI